MNSVNLIGRLVRDPELKYSKSGMAILKFTVAVDRKLSKDKREEAERNNQPTADFISCTAFGKTAEVIANYHSKGSQIAVEGRIQTGSYEKDGRTIYTTDVLVNSITFVGSKNNNSGGENYQNSNSDADGYSDEGFFPVDNDDIPF
ncbi:single-stranded DNA-binding protein [Peptoniphilus grossensis]|uniref:single-stranded DNA-binding protein n=1 Tax=Peptoniphilus grossensis TaxID=1465756 RepID=UPI0002ED37DA|nr:single-stranded DNA-binding protein [Peptoniphilus grossensis]